MANKKIPLLISLTLCIMAAGLVWVAGSSSSLPLTNNSTSVLDAVSKKNSEEASKKPELKTKGTTVQPPSADTLEALIKEDDESAPLNNNADELEAKISQLDNTLTKLDQQLANQKINSQNQESDAPTTDDTSQTERLKALKDHLDKTN